MSATIHTINKRGADTVRLSDDDLHRAAREHLLEVGDALFGNLPGIMAQIIEHKVWKTRPGGFKNFAAYALAQTSDGLNISNNQRLWMLRCAMDVRGKHMGEWGQVLAKVEEMVRLHITTSGSKFIDHKGNSLEYLGKSGDLPILTDKITYLPSRSPANSMDNNLLRLQNKRPDIYRQVIAGKVTWRDGAREAQMKSAAPDLVDRATSYIRRMDKKDIKRLVEWLRIEGHI